MANAEAGAGRSRARAATSDFLTAAQVGLGLAGSSGTFRNARAERRPASVRAIVGAARLVFPGAVDDQAACAQLDDRAVDDGRQRAPRPPPAQQRGQVLAEIGPFRPLVAGDQKSGQDQRIDRRGRRRFGRGHEAASAMKCTRPTPDMIPSRALQFKCPPLENRGGKARSLQDSGGCRPLETRAG